MKLTIHRNPLGLGIALFLALAAALPAATSVDLSLDLGTPKLLAGKTQPAFLKVGLLARSDQLETERSPVNVAIVLDRSGSMAGEKLAHAKEAARMFVERLGPDDIVSVVIYDDTVEVLIPATKLSDRKALYDRIAMIQSGNRTALFAGVSKGAAEVRKFLSSQRVNRIILLSDGLANVGPSTPEELGSLGKSLAAEGITVSTIGLGLDYNEDLMYRLAAESDGNPAFAERPQDLAMFFDRELRAATSVVVSQVDIDINVAEGIRPVRVYGQGADINGQSIRFTLNQLYHDWENFVIVELEVPAQQAGTVRELASATITYKDMETQKAGTVTEAVAAAFTESEEIVESSTNPDVMVSAVELVAAYNNGRAVELRDLGRIDEARQVLLSNSAFLGENAAKFNSEELQQQQVENTFDAQNLDEDNWNRQRKTMKERNQAADWQVMN